MTDPTRQEYATKPTREEDVRGASSQTIYRVMTATQTGLSELNHPLDVDDYERNRVLLLCYPEWRPRMSEMAIIGPQWERLSTHWKKIEALYDQAIAEEDPLLEAACNGYIRAVIGR